jgi:hypothetical protein
MMDATLLDLRGEHWAEAVPPESHCFVADVDTALEQEILYLPQRQRITDAHHHREADHLGRRVEITEWIAPRRRLRIATLWLKSICSDKAALRAHGSCRGVPKEGEERRSRTYRGRYPVPVRKVTVSTADGVCRRLASHQMFNRKTSQPTWDITMQCPDQDPSRHRSLNVVPFSGQLEVLSGKSRLKATGGLGWAWEPLYGQRG